jgi:hypothetical protein
MTEIVARLTREMVADILNYDPETGIFTWRSVSGRGHRPGRQAGTRSGRKRININGRLVLASQLAWLMVHGVWPDHEIDHKDVDASNDAIANLRRATRVQNQRNVGITKSNKSGFKGVSFDFRLGKWTVRISEDAGYRYLGLFWTKEEAAAIYAQAAKEAHGEFARVK